MVKAAKKNIIAGGSVSRVTTSIAKEATVEAKRWLPVISTGKNVILEAKKRRPDIVQRSVCCTEGDNVVATVKVSGNKDDVQKVMDDVWTRRCGLGKVQKSQTPILQEF